MAEPNFGGGVPAFPRATYRLQFHKDFTFADATALVPYLASLGISHLYASPFLAARAGSTHGYDIIDHNRFNPEVGDSVAFNAMVGALHEHGMGLILDFVPNHMGIGGSDNPWWLDVLEWGPSSPYAAFFDINWNAPVERLQGKVLLPVLGDHYGTVLENGEIRLCFESERGAFAAMYHEHRFPIAVRDYPRILRAAQDLLGANGDLLARLHADFSRLVGDQLAIQDAARVRREADMLRAQLSALALEKQDIHDAIDSAVTAINGRTGDGASFTALHELLQRQSYLVAYWRVAANDINYRRFFDINDLAGLSIQNPELFEISHRLVFQLIAEGKLQGLRLDHIDGLFDPAEYCRRLQDRAAYLTLQAKVAAPVRAVEADGHVRLRHAFYVIVEKILAGHESLPPEWPVDGTTGYEFMTLVNGLFVDPAAMRRLTEVYNRFLGRTAHFPEIVREAKHQILRGNLASELNVVAGEIYRVAQQSWKTRDYTHTAIRDALRDIVASFPVYRTYVTGEGLSDRDRQYLNWAVSQARKHTSLIDVSIFDFLFALLTTDLKQETGRGYDADDVVRIAMKFQQMTGPVMAKSFEDTAFYRYYRLVSLNEVGGEPERFGVSVSAFHHVNAERLKRYPFSMLATATHDHKRGEDTRVRIDVLSEVADEWSRRVTRWSRLNRLKRRELEDFRAPGRNDEYLIYQTLVGAWPLDIVSPDDPAIGAFADRMVAFMTKAVREAKVRSNWTAPQPDYEQGVEGFIRGILDSARSLPFLTDLLDMVALVSPAAAVNGLAQTLLRLTVPGVPDTYQGCELWDHGLVDPDNRRPVDYAARAKALRSYGRDIDIAELLRTWRDGRIKQFLLSRTLALRNVHPALFAAGDYLPLSFEGPHAEDLVGFLRRAGETSLLVLAPRLSRVLLRGDGGIALDREALQDTTMIGAGLPPSARDVLSGAEVDLSPETGIPVGDLLAQAPVALLCSEAGRA